MHEKVGGQKALLDPAVEKVGGQLTPLTPCFRGLSSMSIDTDGNCYTLHTLHVNTARVHV